ncbi:MAG: YibE/F family protein [Candidatus Gracilibacteria bacterium]|jgi:uncharacterized membrane protein
MTKKSFISIYVIVGILAMVLMFIVSGQPQKFTLNEQGDKYIHEFIHGEVQKIMPSSDEDEIQVLGIKANSGEEKSKMISAPVSSMNNFNTYDVGDGVQIYKMTDTSTGNTSYETADYYHQGGLQWVFAIFAVIAIIIARKKGLTAILSIIISLILFYFIFLKMVMAGYSPLTSCLLFVFIVTALTIPLIHGFNKKSLSAILAILVGYLFSILISFAFRDIVQLGNAPDEEFRTLGIMYANIGLADIIIASLFMGAIGALIDTAISISSAIFEALKEHSNQTFGQVYKIGMEVGKDVLGSMINTLLFAYLASSLPFLILISLSKGSSLTELVNMDFIALELTRTFIGAISLVVLIPITASISAYYFTKIRK